MAIGIVDDSEFDIELNHDRNASTNSLDDIHNNNDGNTAKVIDINDGKGRGTGNRAVPEELKKVIGENASIEGSKETKQLTRKLRISDSSLSAYKNGAHSTSSYHKPKKSLIDHIIKAKARSSNKARTKMNLALDQITEDKFEDVKLRDISGVARDMSAIIRNLEPPAEMNNTQVTNVQHVFYAPKVKEEEDYNVIEVNE